MKAVLIIIAVIITLSIVLLLVIKSMRKKRGKTLSGELNEEIPTNHNDKRVNLNKFGKECNTPD